MDNMKKELERLSFKSREAKRYLTRLWTSKIKECFRCGETGHIAKWCNNNFNKRILLILIINYLNTV